jgi:hypothetical protein
MLFRPSMPEAKNRVDRTNLKVRHSKHAIEQNNSGDHKWET